MTITKNNEAWIGYALQSKGFPFYKDIPPCFDNNVPLNKIRSIDFDKNLLILEIKEV
jgi:hypothetical protein